MRQTPDAVLDDGLLDVTVIPEVKPSVILRQMHKLYTKRFLKIPQITHAKGKEVLVVPVDKYREQLLEIDGEVVGNAPVKFMVLDTQLNVIKK
jgi:diacylglycerol kinase family enzyme